MPALAASSERAVVLFALVISVPVLVFLVVGLADQRCPARPLVARRSPWAITWTSSLLDRSRRRLYGFLIPDELDQPTRKIAMDAIYILLTLALFASSLAFVRLCERV